MASTKVLDDAFKRVVSTLGEGTTKAQKEAARATFDNALLRQELSDQKEENKGLMRRMDQYAVVVNDRLDNAVSEVSTGAIALTATGAGIGFVVEMVAPTQLPNYPGIAKAIPYVVGGLIAFGSYVLTEPEPGQKPDNSTRYSGVGFGIGMMSGAGLQQVGSYVTDALLKGLQPAPGNAPAGNGG